MPCIRYLELVGDIFFKGGLLLGLPVEHGRSDFGSLCSELRTCAIGLCVCRVSCLVFGFTFTDVCWLVSTV
jgi:hypothetical protein